ncbi:radical SAM protein [Streptomyces alkaliterrae]|uniref:Radical SAM protein n=1 Tax=Streptomyces alkaliterrae TaxID=2213162 RepID=A0A5P0YMM1_9ACTN|nr:radical SAM protein [Streptomyces alkaliterrae]MBB1252276.1 radical SAM protein [Streptomyces alkaliterrae]MBB1257960.1 radical SAM protein [Streptomyces alkaliterrae]MQS01160.1 radical SAM protein [Streptomyces alkaliterrae]
MTAKTDSPANPTVGPLRLLELEITGRCQLACTHCYAESGPTKGHGSMTGEDWRRVISEAAAFGVEQVQFIGGEPSLHSEFAGLVRHALDAGLSVQVYSNLYRVLSEHWDLFAHPRLTLGTSYYSDDPAEHDAVTGRAGSHAATRANIVEAVRRGIPVKVGIIHMREGQRTEQARAEMAALGVEQVGIDRVREVGNAAVSVPSTSALCGRCANGIAAILPDGTVAPCVIGRFLPAGQVQGSTLKGVLTSARWQEIAESLRTRRPTACAPDCVPADSDSCKPSSGTPCNPMSYAPTPLR